MTKSNLTPQDEEVLMAFAVEPSHDAQTIKRYTDAHPHLVTDLLDLLHELDLSRFEDVQSDMPETSVQKASALYQQLVRAQKEVMPAAKTNAIRKSFVSSEVRQIGLPISILSALRDCAVLTSSIPLRWMKQIASTGKYEVEDLFTYLERPQNLSTATSYKSDVKPATGDKATFRELVLATDLTDSEKAELLKEE